MRTKRLGDVTIRAVDGGALPTHLVAQIDAIFFEASRRSAFASANERAAFRERWLGRYLAGGSDVVLVAHDLEGAVAGYLVGALDDPAEQERFADIGYFRGAFRELCRRYPAHLHINLAPAFRSRGIGARLIAAFSARAVAVGTLGFHVVTAKDARNVRFYTRCGLSALGTTSWSGREVVFLGRALPGGESSLSRR
ncbi:MAG: GNAT family N-acetyltransferase [Hyphomicrobiaceae bacterium]|nr:GNAT family N-acetyltransferase [Hyphomicrobiaceae bacterium]